MEHFMRSSIIHSPMPCCANSARKRYTERPGSEKNMHSNWRKTLPHFRITSFLHLICKLIISIFYHFKSKWNNYANVSNLFWTAHRISKVFDRLTQRRISDSHTEKKEMKEKQLIDSAFCRRTKCKVKWPGLFALVPAPLE